MGLQLSDVEKGFEQFARGSTSTMLVGRSFHIARINRTTFYQTHRMWPEILLRIISVKRDSQDVLLGTNLAGIVGLGLFSKGKVIWC